MNTNTSHTGDDLLGDLREALRQMPRTKADRYDVIIMSEQARNKLEKWRQEGQPTGQYEEQSLSSLLGTPLWVYHNHEQHMQLLGDALRAGLKIIEVADE